MDEIKKIVETLKDWRKAYYNGEPKVSDADLEDQLRQLDPENEYFDGIGEDDSGNFPKAKHVLLMGSQDKCNTVEDIVKKLKHFAGKKVALIVEPKCDGLSLELNYKNGKASMHITRGDGYEGDEELLVSKIKTMYDVYKEVINFDLFFILYENIYISKQKPNEFFSYS